VVESSWNCEDDVGVMCGGRVGGIEIMMCAICFELWNIKYLSGTPVHFCMYIGTSRLVYGSTSHVLVFRMLWVLKSQLNFLVSKLINI